MSSSGKTPLVFLLQGKTLNAEEFKTILKDSVVDDDTKLFEGSKWMLLHDGAHAHRAKTIKEWTEIHPFLASEDFPPTSPDLNIIENVWASMKAKIYAKPIQTTIGVVENTSAGMG